MPNPTISQLRASNNQLYDIVDQGARDLIDQLGAVTKYVGELSPTDTHYSSFEDGVTYTTVVVKEGQSGTKTITAEAGDILTKTGKEFIFDGTAWREFGDASELGNFAYADTGTVSIKPKGTNAASSVTFTSHTKDNVLGESTTFTNASSSVSFGTPSKDNVLGVDTDFTATAPEVTVGTPSTATVLKSDVTATVPKSTPTSKYMAATATGTATSNSKLVTTSVPNVTNVGSASVVPSFGAVVTDGVLSFNWDAGSASVPPTLGTAITVATGSVNASGAGASVATGISTQPTIALSEESSTATGRVQYVKSVTDSGTNAVTFSTSGHTASAITAMPTITASAPTITAGDDDVVSAVTAMPTATAAAQTITVGTNDKVSAITALGTGTAAAQTFTGTQEEITVYPST